MGPDDDRNAIGCLIGQNDLLDSRKIGLGKLRHREVSLDGIKARFDQRVPRPDLLVRDTTSHFEPKAQAFQIISELLQRSADIVAMRLLDRRTELFAQGLNLLRLSLTAAEASAGKVMRTRAIESRFRVFMVRIPFDGGVLLEPITHRTQ